MAIASYGYSGAIIPGVVFANWQMGAGTRGYWCRSNVACQATGKPDGTRQVQISTGLIGAWGVVDNVTAVELVTLGTVVSGIKYWVVAAHRDWSGGTDGNGETTFVAIDAGTALPANLPSTLASNPGVLDDQPIALVSLAAGDSVPTIVYDLRMWGGNERLNCFDMPQNYLAYNKFYGNRIRFTSGITYEWVLNPTTRNGFWLVDPLIVRAGPNLGDPLSTSTGAGWSTVGSVETRAKQTGNNMEVLFQARRVGASLSFTGTEGNVVGGDNTVMTVGNTSWQPPYAIPLKITYFQGTATFNGGGEYLPNGQVKIESGQPSTSITKTDSGISFRAQASWIREP